MQAGSSCVFLYQKQMNVQLRHGWVLQKRQFLMVLQFSSSLFCRACLRCHFPSSIIKRFQLGASGCQAEIPNFGAHTIWNYWAFVELSTGKREQSSWLCLAAPPAPRASFLPLQGIVVIAQVEITSSPPPCALPRSHLEPQGPRSPLRGHQQQPHGTKPLSAEPHRAHQENLLCFPALIIWH